MLLLLKSSGEAGATEVSVAATEAADSASVSVNVSATLAATEASDSASVGINVSASLAATESSDTASAAINVTAALSATEVADSFSSAINVTAQLVATEEPDTANITVEEAAEEVVLNASEEADRFRAEFEWVAPGGGSNRKRYTGTIRKASPETVRAMLKWLDELELKRKQKVEVKQAVKDVLKATEDDTQYKWFSEQVRLIYDVLVDALTREAEFKVQQETRKILDMVSSHVQALRRKQQQEQEEEEDIRAIIALLEEEI